MFNFLIINRARAKDFTAFVKSPDPVHSPLGTWPRCSAVALMSAARSPAAPAAVLRDRPHCPLAVGCFPQRELIWCQRPASPPDCGSVTRTPGPPQTCPRAPAPLPEGPSLQPGGTRGGARVGPGGSREPGQLSARGEAAGGGACGLRAAPRPPCEDQPRRDARSAQRPQGAERTHEILRKIKALLFLRHLFTFVCKHVQGRTQSCVSRFCDAAVSDGPSGRGHLPF